MPTALAMMEADAQRVAVADVTIDEFLLDGRPMDADVRRALLNVSLDRRLDGASAIVATLADAELRLLNSPLFRKAVELNIFGLPFVLCDVDLTDDGGFPGLRLEFEPRAISKLRRQTAAMHASRNDKTRAEFIKALCDRAGVGLVCPSLHKRQPIQSVEDAKTPAERKRDRDPGLKKGVKVTVKGQVADSEQLSQIEKAMGVAHSLNASALAQMAMVCAGIGESGFRAIMNQGGSPYGGVFQGNVRSGLWRLSDTEGMAHSFLKGGKGFQGGGAMALAAAHPDWGPGLIAVTVEGSRANFASDAQAEHFYGRYRDEATAILEAFGAGGPIGSIAGEARPEYAVAYMFRTLTAEETSDPGPENYWACARRLAGEVNWRLWEDEGAIYLMTDDEILRSEVQHTVTPGAQGIHSVTGKVTTRRAEQEVVVVCDARRLSSPPATVWELEGYGPPPTDEHTLTLSGRWICADISRPSLSQTTTSVTLHRRQKAKAEPAHDVRTRAGEDPASPSLAGGLPDPGVPTGDIPAKGTPKQIVDTIVLPIAREAGVGVTAASVEAANARHGPTIGGARSDHQGPPQEAWAADMSNGGAPTPQMDRLARDLAKRFGIPWTGAGLVNKTDDNFRYQLIYRTNEGGNHFNHVHFGIRRIGNSAGPARSDGRGGRIGFN